MVRTQVSFDEREYALAKKEARAQGISLAEFVRRAIRDACRNRAVRHGCVMRASLKLATRNRAVRSTRWYMVLKTEAYVDTSALIALLDRSDSYHSLFRRLFMTPPLLVTSALVIAEGHGWFLRRYDQNRAIQFLSFVSELTMLQIAAFDNEVLSEVGRLIKKFHDQPLTLADAHGLAIMGHHRLSICWSTDRHLGMAGVRLVIDKPTSSAGAA